MPGYTIIYRKSDKAICGYCHPRRTEVQRLAQVATKLQDICTTSELGGEPGDYATVEVDEKLHGMEPVIDDSGDVTWVESEETRVDRESKAALSTKLKALGLDDDDLQLLKLSPHS
jgi:hypothetical protein